MDEKQELKNKEIIESKNVKKTTRDSEHISYKLLGLLFIFLVIGIVSVLIGQNIINKEILSFSTVGLVSFLLSVALGSASITLAIAAINLGKFSEKAMIDRSEESIKLQNNIFVKTIEALQRIESSTGVTEKRLEDVVAGVSNISERVASRVMDDRLVIGGGKKQLEQGIKESILAEIDPVREKSRTKEEVANRKKQREARFKYDKFKNSILLSLANTDGVTVKKIGDGSLFGLKDGLADGVFEFKGNTIAVSVFSLDKNVFSESEEDFYTFFERVVVTISEGIFGKMFLVFDDGILEGTECDKAYKRIKSIVKDDIYRRIIIIPGTCKDITKSILKD